MNWHTGLRRLRLVATLTLVLGVLLCVTVFATRSLGYAPDDAFASLFTALWPIGLALVLLGGLLWVAVWVLHGFLPAASIAEQDAEPTRRRAPLDQ